jgi:predicted deacylase
MSAGSARGGGPSGAGRARDAFRFAGVDVGPGHAATAELPIPSLVTGVPVSIPVRITHGRADGPVVWISAALHGDEIAGVEIIRRINAKLDPRRLRGTVLSVPIVNVHGFLTGTRYLPDRRDLNRSFPGSASGSLAGRIAHAFMREVVARCDIGIDLHTGSDHRTNLAQVRGNLDDGPTRELARAFGAPLLLHAGLRDGSLRAAATEAGATVLLFEGGEAWRFDEPAIEAGARGSLRVLTHLGMIDFDEVPLATDQVESRRSRWIRARRSGIALIGVNLGQHVARGQQVAVIHDSLGARLGLVKAPFDGIVAGMTNHPLVLQGDALVHLAAVDRP